MSTSQLWNFFHCPGGTPKWKPEYFLDLLYDFYLDGLILYFLAGWTRNSRISMK